MRRLQNFHKHRLTSLLIIALAAILLVGCGSGSDSDFIDQDFDYVNTPPGPSRPLLVAYYDSYETSEDLDLWVSELYGVLANDYYSVYATTITWPRYSDNGGYIDGYPNGSFEYEPPSGFTGEDTFTYTLTDQDGQTSSARVYIKVYPVGFRANGV